MSAIGWSGFNLLPYRSGARRRARNRTLAVIAGAGLAGCAAVGAMAAWDEMDRVRIDEKRNVLDVALQKLQEPVAEHARLVDTQALQRRAQTVAVPLAEPRARFLGLLDTLARVSSHGSVDLQRVTQRAQEVELAASAPDSHAAATWLKSLESASGVRAVEIVEMRRRTGAAASARPGSGQLARVGKTGAQDKAAAYDFVAIVRWTQGAVTGSATRPLKAGARDASPGHSRGAR